ncbi:MAG TPA: choice-of-anchor Q domain-containing protein [Nocardioides sp.]|jgi:CSLREA domain-containing protein|uniref:choice-of-anchor Q domain-containing protein n=1 Tax=Nocardioides sp. TaxID=35761 RepID=UPI002E300916|nr:choice-of-anchor Q domain-containing protein [Nocardioides sp.]HEX3932127.1 choice-of-anchor Q domain-containing protein [Nocardioides sp.]
MTTTTRTSALAVVSAAIAASGLALTAPPAQAAGTGHSPAPAIARPAAHAVPTGSVGKRLTGSRLAQARAKQRQMAASSSRPAFAKAAAKTFTVNTTEDSDLANPTGTTCHDASTGECSLRAAVDAANNLDKPVRIVLGRHTYTLGLGTQIIVSNHHGTSIEGQGAGKTSVAADGSGIFYVSYSSTGPASLFLSSLTLKNGTTTDGGAIQTAQDEGIALNLDHVTARNNTASSDGGAIYAYGSTTVYIDHSTFRGNHAVSGGAIYQYWSDVEIHDSTFTTNSSPAGTDGFGGAILSYYGVLDMAGGSMTGNQAGDATGNGEGGALWDEGGITTLTGVHVDHNAATSGGAGGAIYAYEDTLTLDHGTMSHNKVTGPDGAGGGIYTYYNSQLTVDHATMAGNHASGNADFYGGGTIYAYGYEYPEQISIDRSTITGSNASALYLVGYYGVVDASITNSTLSKNLNAFNNGYTDLGCGGAVCAYGYEYGDVHLDMEHNKVTGNGGVGDGGSGAVTQYAYYYSPSTSTFSHNTFANNHSGAGGYGGALGFYTDASEYSPISVRMSANTFTGNRAGSQGSHGFGGAVSAGYAVNLVDKGSHFSKNRAVGDGAGGGAVVDESTYGSARFSRSVFTGNSAGTNDAGNDGAGGAAYLSTYNGTVFDQVSMSGNKAAGEGGGIFADDDAYQLRITSSTISGNTAGSNAETGYGGGIFAEDAVTSIENSTLTGNRAQGSSGYGGGIFYEGSRLALRYSTVSANYAKRGAGIYGETYGTLLGSIVSGNRTARHGSEKDCGVDLHGYQAVSYGGNVVGQSGCVVGLRKSDKVAKKARLGKLKDNGGPTKTMAISKKSPAVGRASYLVPGTDQRGHERPAKHADSGAYELAKHK